MTEKSQAQVQIEVKAYLFWHIKEELDLCSNTKEVGLLLFSEINNICGCALIFFFNLITVVRHTMQMRSSNYKRWDNNRGLSSSDNIKSLKQKCEDALLNIFF